jgi:WD40 repeat protein
VTKRDERGDAESVGATLPASLGETLADTGSGGNAQAPVLLTTKVAGGRYELHLEIGRGGLGRVVRAYDRRLDRPIALKSLIARGTDVTARFLDEARITARLEHPAIVPVHDSGTFPDGEPFYTMKLVTGRSLHDAIAAATSFADRLALLPSVITVADALAYAHSRGIIHRDLKPLNVLVGEFGETLVIDWGLAKELARGSVDPRGRKDATPLPRPISVRDTPATGATLDGSVLGTPQYMPPEQARGEPVDERADVYSIGAILYNLLSGQPPYGGRTSEEVLLRVLAAPPTPLAAIEPAVPPDLAAIVARAMATDRKDRYPTARELAEDLKRFQTGKLVAARSYGAGELVRRWIRRHRAVLALGAFSLVVLATIGVISLRQIVEERATAQRERAEAERREREANTERRRAEERSAALTLEQARAAEDHDPTRALAWLKRLAGERAADSVPWEDVRLVAADAVSRGVARFTLTGPADDINHVEVTLDGRLVITSGDNGSLKIWDPVKGRIVASVDDARVNAFVLSSDAVLTAEDGGVAVRGLDAKVMCRLTGGAPIDRIVLSSGGNTLYGAAHDGSLHAWSGTAASSWDRCAEPTSSTVMPFPGKSLAALAPTADGGVIVGDAEGHIVRWRASDPHVEELTSTGEPLEAVLVEEDAGRILALGPSRVLAIDLRTPHRSHELAAVNGIGHGFVRSRDHRWLAIDVETSVTLIDEQHPETPARRFDDGRYVAFSEDDRFCAVTVSGKVRVLDLVGGTERTYPHVAVSSAIAFSHDGRFLVTTSQSGLMRVFELDAGARGWTWESEVRRLAVSPDGRRVAWGGIRGGVGIADVETGAVRRVDMTGTVIDLVIGPDNRALVAEIDGDVTRVDLDAATSVRLAHEQGYIACVAASASGQLAWSGQDRLLHVADAEGRELAAWPQPVEIIACRFLPDGRLAVGTDPGELQIIDPATGHVLERDRGHTAQVTAIDVAPDGTIASASIDGTARVWRGTGESRIVAKHGASVWSIAISRDASLIASGGSDRTLRISGIDGHVIEVVRHDNDVSSASFAPDGTWVATSSLDRTARLWRIDRAAAPPASLASLRAWLDAHTSVTLEQEDGR